MKHKCPCDGDHIAHDIVTVILLIIVLWGWTLYLATDHVLSPMSDLGKGFANQTCIDKGMVLTDVIYGVGNQVKIICNNVSTHIDGTSYIIETR